MGSKKTFSGSKTVPEPFALSESNHPKNNNETIKKEEFVPLKVLVDNYSSTLRTKRDEDSEPVKYVDVGRHHLTLPNEPKLLSAERSKLKQDLISTEDKILEDIQMKGAFKAKSLNRKLFEPVEPLQF